jgi:simple sugar transport system permease protein
MIFGQWKPERIAWSAVLFAVFRSLSNVYMGIDFLHALPISGTVYNIMPYVISLLVLAFTSKNSRAPKAEGIPYDKGTR